ncbi:hypothetical protein T06_12385, partial [Trichinella sp. T6]
LTSLFKNIVNFLIITIKYLFFLKANLFHIYFHSLNQNPRW